MRRKGFTLIELLVVVSVLALLLAILLPSFAAVKSKARRVACASQMRSIYTATLAYAAANRNHLPYFGFSDLSTNFPMSEHWGGLTSSLKSPPANLWVLADQKLLPPSALDCPASCMDSSASYFPNNTRFSTYAMRMIYSEDVFRGAEAYRNKYKTLRAAFIALSWAPFTQHMSGSFDSPVSPIRTDRRYRSAAASTPYTIDMSSGAWVADEFWRHGYSNSSGQYPQQQDWCHGQDFNVLEGTGAVKQVADTQGVILSHSQAGDGSGAADDGIGYASHSEEVWRYFDQH